MNGTIYCATRCVSCNRPVFVIARFIYEQQQKEKRNVFFSWMIWKYSVNKINLMSVRNSKMPNNWNESIDMASHWNFFIFSVWVLWIINYNWTSRSLKNWFNAGVCVFFFFSSLCWMVFICKEKICCELICTSLCFSIRVNFGLGFGSNGKR